TILFQVSLEVHLGQNRLEGAYRDIHRQAPRIQFRRTVAAVMQLSGIDHDHVARNQYFSPSVYQVFQPWLQAEDDVVLVVGVRQAVHLTGTVPKVMEADLGLRGKPESGHQLPRIALTWHNLLRRMWLDYNCALSELSTGAAIERSSGAKIGILPGCSADRDGLWLVLQSLRCSRRAGRTTHPRRFITARAWRFITRIIPKAPCANCRKPSKSIRIMPKRGTISALSSGSAAM